MRSEILKRSLPLLRINLGTLGYLTDVDLEDFESALDHLFSETPVIEERMMLEEEAFVILGKIWR